MKDEISLNGKWGLFYYPSDKVGVNGIADLEKVGVNEINTLFVHIKSTVLTAFKKEFSKYHINWGLGMQSFIWKLAHSFSWGIFPRTVSAGIYRDVCLEITDEYGFEDCSYDLFELTELKATISFRFSVKMPFDEFRKDSKIRVTAACGDSRIERTENVIKYSKLRRFEVDIPSPKLWWPYGYGDANVYDLTVELIVDGEVKAIEKMNMGIRKVELKKQNHILMKTVVFKFIINGVEIMCKGTNWVPLDAYHSRDKLRYEQALHLLTDTHCNILRVWGGGVYEQKEFYDYCDRHGIIVWQDFMLAGTRPSMEEDFVGNIREEAVWPVRKYRNHPSIVLWAGDNELDSTATMDHFNLDYNKISREVFRDVIRYHDAGRPYLPSSPYITNEVFEKYKKITEMN